MSQLRFLQEQHVEIIKSIEICVMETSKSVLILFFSHLLSCLLTAFWCHSSTCAHSHTPVRNT